MLYHAFVRLEFRSIQSVQNTIGIKIGIIVWKEQFEKQISHVCRMNQSVRQI